MKLIAVAVWADRYFDEESRPESLTIYRLLRAGKLPGRKVGGSWFVDLDAWLADGDELVQRVLQAG